MRILTVRQPWASAIVFGGKDVENRALNVAGRYRGPVAIHVARRDDDAAFEPEHPMAGLLFATCPSTHDSRHNRHSCTWCTQVPPSRFRWHGYIIGVVDLVDVHFCDECIRLPGFDDVPAPRMCSPWGDTRAHHLVFADPVPIDPIPYRGALGLRTLDEKTTARVLDAACDHDDRCCRFHGTHSMPHRGCILR